jgi:hypothetical protein
MTNFSNSRAFGIFRIALLFKIEPFFKIEPQRGVKLRFIILKITPVYLACILEANAII